MVDTFTPPGTDRRPLITYLRVQRDFDRRMIAILSRSSERITAELRRLETRAGVGAAVRRDQLLLTQAAIQRELADLWTAVGRETLAGRATAAAAAVDTILSEQALRAVMPATDAAFLLRSARASAAATVGTVEARAKLSTIPLAQSVYNNQLLAAGKIDAIVDEALARGASARELARDVRAYVRPDVRGGVRYAAFRLGRTELNNAFHAQQVLTGVETPWVVGLKWNLSGSHPRPDECNDYADKPHIPGGENGVYRPDQVPGKPHPNCLCFTTSIDVGRAAFIDNFRAGDYDDFVDSVMRSGAITIR
jgi:hypothetical protein